MKEHQCLLHCNRFISHKFPISSCERMYCVITWLSLIIFTIPNVRAEIKGMCCMLIFFTLFTLIELLLLIFKVHCFVVRWKWCTFYFYKHWTASKNRVMRINSSIEVVYIWTIFGYRCYSWLPHDYFIWQQLQKISANEGKNNCKCANDFT